MAAQAVRAWLATGYNGGLSIEVSYSLPAAAGLLSY
jgi:hypothetical protein